MRRSLLFLVTLCILMGAPTSSLAESKAAGSQSGAEVPFPDACENPFAEARLFSRFFESSISNIAVERGAAAKGVADLFAVSELSADLLKAVTNFAEESPIDRLLRSQLCLFEEIYKREKKAGVKTTKALTSSDPLLHEHLLAVAPQLFEDSLKVLEDVYSSQARQARLEARARQRQARVQEARRLGRRKVDAKL